MSLDVAHRISDFAFQNTPQSENIDFGFFGGEPLLEFPTIQEIVRYIETHSKYDSSRVKLSVVTNGTLLTEAILRFVQAHEIALTISCDGPAAIHDKYRHFAGGGGTSAFVENGIRLALKILGRVPVNAVYRPDNVRQLPEVIDYFSSLGVRQIYLNPDLSARWDEEVVSEIPRIFAKVAGQYVNFYRQGQPHFISLIDGKITVMLRGGYQPTERCRMGTGEMAFTPTGDVFPCERLVDADRERHVIGTVDPLVQIGPLRDHFAPREAINTPCMTCGISDYCVTWCGCSNYFMTGYYNRVNPFLCVSERTAIELAVSVFSQLESELGPVFADHMGGKGLAPSARDMLPAQT
jgi:uncharacterized protein